MEMGAEPDRSPWHSLNVRVTVFTLVIFVLGIWALSFYAISSLRAEMERLVAEQQFSVVTAAAQTINDDLTDRMQALQTVAKELDETLLTRPVALQARLQQRPLLQLLFNAGVSVVGLDGAPAALQEGRVTVSPPILDSDRHFPLISITVPVRDAQGKVFGGLSGLTDLGKPHLLKRFTLGAHGKSGEKSGEYWLIHASSGQIITTTDKPRAESALSTAGAERYLGRNIAGYEGHSVQPNVLGEMQLVSVKQIPAAQWALVLGLPVTEAFASVREIQQRLLWASLLLTALTGLLTWLVLRRQLVPLVATANAMTSLAHSNEIPQPIVAPQQGEIGQLVAGFNRILEQNLERESALSASKSFKDAVLDSLSAEIAVVDRNGVIQAVNARWQQFALDNSSEPGRLAPRTGVGTSYLAVCNGDVGANAQGMAEVRDGLQSVLNGRLPRFSHEYRCDSPEQQRWFSMVIMPLGEDGAVVSHTDITALKQTAQALAASEERWKFAIEGSGDGLWDWNIQSGKAFYSPRYKSMLGFAEHEIGDSAAEWRKCIHPEDAPAVLAALQPYLDGQPGAAEVEFRMRCKDGSWMWMHGRGMVVQRDAEGKPLRMIGTNTDITERKQSQARLQMSEARFRKLLQDVPLVAVQGYGEDGTTHYWNQASERLYGFSADEAVGRNLLDTIIPLDMRDGVRQAMREMFATGMPIPAGELSLRRKDGSRVDVLSSHVYVQVPGQAPEMFCVDVDLTERKQAEANLQLAAGVFTHALEGITITDAQGIILDVNAAFTRITGYTREEVLGQNPRILQSGRQDKAFYTAMWKALTEQGHWSGEVWNRRKNGEVLAELLTISAVRNAQGQTLQYVALFSDITAIKAQQSQLEHIAHFDALTNLPNRVLLADRLQQAMVQAQRRQKQLAVAYLDLDGFKAINDHHGHQTGDQVLITLAQRMKEALREGDTIARMGGDEFVAVLIDLQDTQASVPLLGRLLAAAAEPVQAEELILQVSASLGVTFFPQTQDIDADQLLRQADQAMYQAKLAGKSRYHVFDAAQDSSLRSHHESLERIRLALERHEFLLHYQPKVNMRTGQVVGVEALIRWQHPEKGLLAPGTFLPVIEDHPLAVDVGEWVIVAALTQIERWHAAGLDLPISVNIGARQLQQGDFLERLQAILASHPQVRPASLELEVLETSALADMAQVSQLIDDCAGMGVRFALDDFGTGYSSLTYLKRLNVALLKIDQSFVRDMLDDADDLAILRGVIGLAAAFKREVIAEGVETVAHGTALLKLGCELAQGYGIARPMPPGQMLDWVAGWEPDVAWCELPWLGGVTQDSEG